MVLLLLTLGAHSPIQRRLMHLCRCVCYICISYVTSVRYVAGINHEARGSSDLFRKRTEAWTSHNNLCRHEPVAMVNGAKFLVLSP